MSQGRIDRGVSDNGLLRFFFAPKDPTTLAFMRIMTGLLVLYILFAYSFDLKVFFGPDGWAPLEMANNDRHNRPFHAPSFNDWEDTQQANVRLPYAQHRRKAIVTYLKNLPDEPRQRDEALRYYYQLPPSVDLLKDGLTFIDLMPLDEDKKAERLDKILTTPPGPVDPSTAIPPVLHNLPMGEEREKAQEAVIRFLSYLPGGDRWKESPEDDPLDAFDQRRYVLNFLEENIGNRDNFRQFIKDLPRDTAERHARIDYLDEWDIEPSQAYAKGMPIWSIWYHVTNPTGMWIAHITIMVIVLMFTVGCFTRVTSVLTWLAVLSYTHRTQQVLFGVDTMMNIALIYMMFAPAGAALSVDRLIQRYRIIRASYRRSGTIDALARLALQRPAELMSAGFVTRLFQIHFCFIYISGGLSKLKGDTWWSTYALWLTLMNPEFTPINNEGYEWMMRQLAEHRWLAALATTGGVYFTLATEISLPFLVWTKLRPYMVMFSAALHSVIGIFMGLTVFSLFMMVLVFGFVSPAAVRERMAGGANLPRFRLRFRGDDPGQLRRAALIGALDVSNQVEWHDLSRSADPKAKPGPTDLEVVGPDGKVLAGSGAMAVLLRKLRVPSAGLYLVLGALAVGAIVLGRFAVQSMAG